MYLHEAVRRPYSPCLVHSGALGTREYPRVPTLKHSIEIRLRSINGLTCWSSTVSATAPNALPRRRGVRALHKYSWGLCNRRSTRQGGALGDAAAARLASGTHFESTGEPIALHRMRMFCPLASSVCSQRHTPYSATCSMGTRMQRARSTVRRLGCPRCAHAMAPHGTVLSVPTARLVLADLRGQHAVLAARADRQKLPHVPAAEYY